MNIFSIITTLTIFFGYVAAHIGSVSTTTTSLTVTSSSVLPLTFSTITSPTNNIDFSVVVGLAPASDHDAPPSLGETWLQNFDLVALGHAETNTGSFTLQVPINTSNAGVFTSGTFTVTAAVTSAFGALYGTQLEFFQVTVQLTI
ncbi:hypothetical protein BOTBODRAFT_34710 [Botryobasidium botryosum FD-172 SS1]|uniref:Secreted protein n=1 Tax=Botryobasidium botryosum (strain FD-172 SS1) TaxID=930990 RepID=A0A067MKJ1_BOTB1|nr:hypothetical protein BOTBODRAFT_34710 [Botryobasidium botryosum FD-172 SS1]